MTIRVCKEEKEDLIYSYDEEDYATLAAMYIWCEGCLGDKGVYTHQSNVGGPYFVYGFDIGGDRERIDEFYSAFSGIFKNAIIGPYVTEQQHWKEMIRIGG